MTANWNTQAKSLRELRKNEVLSQQELAMQSGVAKTTIVDLEAGRIANPRPVTIRKLAAVLKLNPRQLALILEQPN